MVALVPLPALDTVIVQTAVSPTKYSSLSLVISTDKSTIGTGVIVQSTIVSLPLGPTTVKLLVKLPKSLTLTLTVITALPLVTLVKTQVIT